MYIRPQICSTAIYLVLNPCALCDSIILHSCDLRIIINIIMMVYICDRLCEMGAFGAASEK